MARVIYLGGLGRSGTTLVERLLGELPTVCALGEVVHLWQRDVRDDERCGCGEHFSACAFWRAVGERAFGGWSNVDVDRVHALRDAVERTRHIPRLAAGRVGRAVVREYADYYGRVYAAAAAVSGAEAVVDSSKHSSLAHVLRLAENVDLRVVHVVRDARGVAYSWTKTVDRPETDGAQTMTRYPPTRSAMLWNAHNAAFGLLARRGVPVRRIRYEEFLTDPRAALVRLADFAGLRIAPTDLDFLRSGHADLRTGHSAAGNPMRFTVGRLPLRHDDAWMQALPRAQRRLVGAMCAPMLRAYGYPINPAQAHQEA
ncbi:sulfotransferase [Mangrovihabitans endophyticus]|uniref:Sulfotransferase n=1 Tax=Mangrovihabitans endophyticus TaxID=1751298 RepID=A0A8J3C0N0_9ACTN|nr:sulfotransferase [Mangrovihabitans endophyticus]GGK92009.1 sulfotransferase [Mangrovihabitans endophyticus]